MKILKVYIKVIVDASERCWSLTSEQNSAQQTASDSDEFSDEFDDFGASFLQLSDGDCYDRLMYTVFMKDCLIQLPVSYTHLTLPTILRV